jgi:hypothetical protein
VKTIALLLFACMCFDVSADVKGGIAASKRGDYATAFAEFNIAASKDDAFAQNALGTMYAQGIGVERNYKLALDWFFRAQALGSPEAMANLGKMHETGIGVPQNNAVALRYYREAAIDGFPPAILRMAEIHENGDLGVAVDKAAARGWRARLHPAEDAAGETREEPDTAVAPPAARPKATSAATTVVSGLSSGVAAARTHADRIDLLERQLALRLEKYRQRERKLFVASTDKTPTLAAYLTEARARLAGLLTESFSASTLREKLIVSLSIRKDGRLSNVELDQDSGNARTNSRILSILKEAKAFQVLPAAIAKDIDVLVVTFRLPLE